MKKITLLLFGLFFISAQAQDKEQLLTNITNEVCDCLEKADKDRLDENAMQVLTNCVQISFSKNVDDVIEIYGTEAIESAKVGEEIGLEVGTRLLENCKYYSDYLNGVADNIEIVNVDYTDEQLTLIDQLGDWACECSNKEVEKNADVNLQNTLEMCLQQVVIQNVESLTNEFGEELLANQNLMYNIGVDMGNKLMQTCDLFIANNEGSKAIAKANFVIGKVTDYKSRGDFIEITLLDLEGRQSKYVVNYGFILASEFVSNLKDLKNNETAITIYYNEGELYFKKEDVKKVVNIIEDVKF